MDAITSESDPVDPGVGLPCEGGIPPPAEVLDRHHLSQLQSMKVPGRGTLFSELVEIYQKESPAKIESLRLAVAARDAVQFSKLTHAMVGSLSTLGARQAQAAVRALESLANGGDWVRIEKAHTEVLAALQRLQEALKVELRKEVP